MCLILHYRLFIAGFLRWRPAFLHFTIEFTNETFIGK